MAEQMERSERIALYEQFYDEVLSALKEGEASREDIQEKVRLLDEYYTSGEWREDYEADEAGELPANLKRGVLSQDALYDLLAEFSESGESGDVSTDSLLPAPKSADLRVSQ